MANFGVNHPIQVYQKLIHLNHNMIHMYQKLVHMYHLLVHKEGDMYQALFGNRVAEFCLLYIANYGQGHIRGIARTFGISPGQVRLQLERLESGGILVNQFAGRTKLFRINPRLAIKVELTALLEKTLALVSEEDNEKYFRERRRPRRTGKSL